MKRLKPQGITGVSKSQIARQAWFFLPLLVAVLISPSRFRFQLPLGMNLSIGAMI
jgi:hypothetical protein